MNNRFPLLEKAERYIRSARLLMNDNDGYSACHRHFRPNQ